MHSKCMSLLSFALLCVIITTAARASAPEIVGVNVVGPDQLTVAQQDDLISQLQRAGVKVIRTGLVNEKNVEFIIKAYRAGIRTLAIVWPDQILPGRVKSPANKAIGRSWAVPRFSDIDTDGFRKAFTPHLTALDAAGVHLEGIEFGNEFNTASYNGDFASPGSGRVLGITDLENERDGETKSLAKGVKAILKALQVLKDVRDHSSLNATAPIISGGLADINVAGTVKPGSSTDYVAIADTINFLRKNGLDSLVDGYGIHTYPSSDPGLSVSARERTTVEARGVLSACGKGGKPCWITEWGFSVPNKSCPVDDRARANLVVAQRSVFRDYIEQGRVAALFYYSWRGLPGNDENEWAIFRCGALTNSGKLALQAEPLEAGK